MRRKNNKTNIKRIIFLVIFLLLLIALAFWQRNDIVKEEQFKSIKESFGRTQVVRDFEEIEASYYACEGECLEEIARYNNSFKRLAKLQEFYFTCIERFGQDMCINFVDNLNNSQKNEEDRKLEKEFKPQD